MEHTFTDHSVKLTTSCTSQTTAGMNLSYAYDLHVHDAYAGIWKAKVRPRSR
jgi:hypothetical protein